MQLMTKPFASSLELYFIDGPYWPLQVLVYLCEQQPAPLSKALSF